MLVLHTHTHTNCIQLYLTYFLPYIPSSLLETMPSAQNKKDHNNPAWLCGWDVAVWQDHQHNQSARGWVASGLCISTMDRGSRSQASIGASGWLLHSPLHIAPQQTSQIDYRAPSPRARGFCSANNCPNQSDSQRCDSGSQFYTRADDNEPT